jgi:hypothetical protein
MSIHSTTAKKTTGTRRIYMSIGLSLTLLVSVLACVPAFAQESGSGLGMDQESLLPPEVVPLDPSAASQMSRSQAASREATLGSSTASQSVPGLSGLQPLTPPSDMQSAQDFRKSMFNSLYNQGTLAPNNQAPQAAPSFQGQQGQGQQGQGQQGQGQQGMMTQQPQQQSNQFGQSQQPNQQVSQSGWMNANGAPQQQTLSGGVQNPSGKPNNTFNTVKHVLGTATGFGGGVLTGALMMQNRASSPYAMLGLGLMGASVLNYGMRNAWRGF